MERSDWAWMPIMALLFCCVEFAPCAAQSPPPSEASEAAADRPDADPADGDAPADSPRTDREGDAARTPNPLATDLTLRAAPLAPTDFRFPINLATALRLSDARPLVVAAAQ